MSVCHICSAHPSLGVSLHTSGLISVSPSHTQAHAPTALQPTYAFRPTASMLRSCHTVTSPLSCLSLNAHTPWRMHTHTSTTHNPQPCYTTATTTCLSPVTATAAIYMLLLPLSTCHRHCILHATSVRSTKILNELVVQSSKTYFSKWWLL